MALSATTDALSAIVVHTQLEDGRKVCLRTVRPSDEARMRRGIELLSSQSRYLRFFSGAPVPPDKVIASLVEVDGHRHLAWGAILSDDPAHPAVGAVHAVRNNPASNSAEFAVGILDAFHGLGLARMLTAVLLVQCRSEGIDRMDVQILSENYAAASLVRSLGAEKCGSEQGVSNYVLHTQVALGKLQHNSGPAGIAAVFTAFADYI